MELVVDFACLRGARNEIVVKELAIAGYDILQAYHFKSPYTLTQRVVDASASNKTGMHWDDGYLPYSQLKTVLEEITAGYAHLYAYGDDKCEFLSDLINRPFLNLADFRCPRPDDLKQKYSCGFSCHKFNSVHCATKHAHAMFKWLVYHLQAKENVKCPANPTERHTSSFVSAI